MYVWSPAHRICLNQIQHYLFIVSNFFQECPSGVVNEETFKEIYSQFFPQGGEYLANVIGMTMYRELYLFTPESNKRSCSN